MGKYKELDEAEKLNPTTAKPSVADQVIECVVASGVRTMRTVNGVAVVLPDQPLCAYGLREEAVRGYIKALYMREHGKGVTPNTEVAVLAHLEGMAYQSEVLMTYNRMAVHNGIHYYDLGDGSRVVRIDSNGWEVVNECPVLFKRHAAQVVQVTPQRGGNLKQLLEYLNIKEKSDEVLLLTYLIVSMHATIARSGLALFGDAGASKTTILKILRTILDPMTDGQTPAIGGGLLQEPPDARELALRIQKHYCLFFDNLSDIPDWFSDALAKLITGSNYIIRKNYADSEELIVNDWPLVAFNGIVQVANRPDLLDRLILIELDRIPAERRLEESLLWQRILENKALWLGALFDALSASIPIMPTLTFKKLPRMADYHRAACAAAMALGYTQAEFEQAAAENILRQRSTIVDESPLAQAILLLVKEGDFEDTPSALLLALSKTSIFGLPRSPRSLGKQLARIRSTLAALKIDVKNHHSGMQRTIKITDLSRVQT